MGKFLLTALLLVGCSERPQYIATCTKERILRPDEVRVIHNVLDVNKAGWITSDRWTLHTRDGRVVVLHGNWTIDMVREEKTNDQ